MRASIRARMRTITMLLHQFSFSSASSLQNSLRDKG